MNNSKYTNRKLSLLFLLCFVVGITGLFLFGLNIPGYVFAHVGALGLLGFLGIGAAYFAFKKGYNDQLAFNLGFSMAILAGLIETILFFLFGEQKQFVCGGAASVIVAFIILLTYGLIKQKSDFQTEKEI